MEDSAEFPDAELAHSPTHGQVFRVPKLSIENEDETQGCSNNNAKRVVIRPQSAKGPTTELPSRVLPVRPKSIRPWSAQPKSRKTDSQRKVSRQPLRKPHFRAPQRSPTASISSDTSSLITAVGLANNRPKTPETPDSSHTQLSDRRSDIPHVSPAKWAVTIAEAVRETEEQDEPISKPEPAKRALKKHPSFETWLAGSPHDSDEYDTDLDVEDFVKNGNELNLYNLKDIADDIFKIDTTLTEEKPVDPTGRTVYMDQCQVQGQIPVSYIQRHLGDKNLRMRHHYLGGEGTKPIAVALFKNTITESLDISDNYVEAEGARYIAGMLRTNTFITNLNLSSNFIGQEGFRHICSMLETNTTLKTLTLSGNQLSDPCARYLIEGLKNNSSLTSLDLSGNDFGELGGVFIGGALSVNEGLMDVDLSWNSIRGRGATAILTSLTKIKSLEVLDLSWNGLGMAGAEALKVSLKVNTTLKVLDLTNNRLNSKAAESLSVGLTKNTTLETLVLNLNPIKDPGVEAILKAVDKHPKISLLSIEDMGISVSNYQKIKEIEDKKDIVILHGGVGGYHRPSATTSMMRLFTRFLKNHQNELEAACHPYDSDRNGMLGIDELKMALKDGGLRLTNRHLNLVIGELNLSNKNSLNYRDLLNGRTLQEYFRQRPSQVSAINTSQKAINTLPDTLHRQLTVI